MTHDEMSSLLTKYEFRKRFTIEERERIDTFNASFEANPSIPDQYKAKLRTGLKDYEASTGVELLDPATIAMVRLYEALGLLDAGRADQVLLAAADEERQEQLFLLSAGQSCASNSSLSVVRDGLHPINGLVEVQDQLGRVFLLATRSILAHE
jgi:hypothetical protein